MVTIHILFKVDILLKHVGPISTAVFACVFFRIAGICHDQFYTCCRDIPQELHQHKRHRHQVCVVRMLTAWLWESVLVMSTLSVLVNSLMSTLSVLVNSLDLICFSSVPPDKIQTFSTYLFTVLFQHSPKLLLTCSVYFITMFLQYSPEKDCRL